MTGIAASTSITELELVSCRGITDGAMRALGRMSGLQALGLGGSCANVSDAGVAVLVDGGSAGGSAEFPEADAAAMGAAAAGGASAEAGTGSRPGAAVLCAAALCGGGYAGAEAGCCDVPEYLGGGGAAAARGGDSENAPPSYGYGLLPAGSWGISIAEAMDMSGDDCDAGWLMADPKNPSDTSDAGDVAPAEGGVSDGDGESRWVAGGVEGYYVSSGAKELRRLDLSRWPDGEFRVGLRV